MGVNIDLTESFPPLARAPIVEAVIDIRARLGVELKEGRIKPSLEAKLDGYQFLDSQQQIEIQHEVSLQGEASHSPIVRKLGWKGMRFQSTDKKYIAQFNRDRFVFSRLEPYESWNRLYQECMRLWHVYVELTQLIEIHRIGLRYINRIQLPPDELRFEDYLEVAPQAPKGLDLPFHSFLYQDTLAVPGYAYAINVAKTIQPPAAPGIQGLGLILDVDVYTTQGVELDEAFLEQRLLEMRWLKNKVFFGSVTPNARKLFH